LALHATFGRGYFHDMRQFMTQDMTGGGKGLLWVAMGPA
jgi:hypothetical protein